MGRARALTRSASQLDLSPQAGGGELGRLAAGVDLGRAFLVGDDLLALLAELLDAELMTSPAFRNSGGFFPRPTPGGVPVVMMSPGSKIMFADVGDDLGDREDHGLGRPVCIRLPFT